MELLLAMRMMLAECDQDRAADDGNRADGDGTGDRATADFIDAHDDARPSGEQLSLHVESGHGTGHPPNLGSVT